MYEIKEIGLFNILGQLKVNHILFECGKDMAKRHNLHHWDNSHFKNFIIVVLCELKNKVYLLEEDGKPTATFQIKRVGDVMRFEKLACSPKYSRKGIGSYCMGVIEAFAKDSNCKKVCMEVYSQSQHALDFYIHRGYEAFGETKTMKYSEVKMEKTL